MKEFLKNMEKDMREEGFSWREWLVYGCAMPVALVVMIGVVGWLEGLFVG